MIDQQQLDTWFGEHETTPAQREAFSDVLEKARAFAGAVNQNMPDGEDKVQVIQSLRQSILTIELAIRYRYRSGLVLAKGMN